jgi:hypothetical protein
MVDCAAPLKAASPIASARASANSVHRAHPGALRMREWYNGEGFAFRINVLHVSVLL